MSKRAHKIINSIVKTIGEQSDDYRRLRPIQQVIWSHHATKWVYNPDPDFLEFLDTSEGEWWLDENWEKVEIYRTAVDGSSFRSEIDKERALVILKNKGSVADSGKTGEIDYRMFVPNMHPNSLWQEMMSNAVQGARSLVRLYNEWVSERNAEYGTDLVAKAPVDKGGKVTVGEVDWADMPKHYERMYAPPLWDLEIQLIPRTRPIEPSEDLNSISNFTDVMGLYGFEDEALYRAYFILAHGKKLDDFVKMFNLMLYDHIQEMREIAEDSGGWNEGDNYWLPNMEFVRYFQKNNINQKKEDRFEEHPNGYLQKVQWAEVDERDEYTEKSMRRLFGGYTKFDDEYSLMGLAFKCKEIKEEHPYHFDTYRDAYKEACNWWTLKGKPITWLQLEKAVHK